MKYFISNTLKGMLRIALTTVGFFLSFFGFILTFRVIYAAFKHPESLSLDSLLALLFPILFPFVFGILLIYQSSQIEFKE